MAYRRKSWVDIEKDDPAGYPERTVRSNRMKDPTPKRRESRQARKLSEKDWESASFGGLTQGDTTPAIEKQKEEKRYAEKFGGKAPNRSQKRRMGIYASNKAGWRRRAKLSTSKLTGGNVSRRGVNPYRP